jgi:xylose isomerase
MWRPKNSLGIWFAGINPTRFLPVGYHNQFADEPMPDKFHRVAEGLGDLLDGFEAHYPSEINPDLWPEIQKAIGNKDMYAVCAGLFGDPEFKMGVWTNPDPGLRKKAIAGTREAIDMAASIGAKFIIWPGQDGYNYTMQADFEKMWTWLVDGIGDAVDYAAKKGVQVYLEDKNTEPKMRILLASQALCMLLIRQLKDAGVDTSKLAVNMDWQHLIMREENLPQYAAMLDMQGILGHQHGNSGWGRTDDDNIVGASYIEQTFGLLVELQIRGYGKEAGDTRRLGYDLFPYTEDQVGAASMSIRTMNHLWDRAALLTQNPELLAEFQSARASLDALTTLSITQEILIGLPRT